MFYNDTAVCEVNVVGDFTRKAHFMCYEHAGHAFLSKFADRNKDFLHRFWIERSGNLIEQHNLGLHC